MMRREQIRSVDHEGATVWMYLEIMYDRAEGCEECE